MTIGQANDVARREPFYASVVGRSLAERRHGTRRERRNGEERRYRRTIVTLHHASS